MILTLHERGVDPRDQRVAVVIVLADATFGVDSLRRGLTIMVSGSATANVGFLIGALYAALYIFTTLIYLDRREHVLHDDELLLEPAIVTNRPTPSPTESQPRSDRQDSITRATP